MPLITPALQGSIRPYFAEVKHYLLTDTTTRKIFPTNWRRLEYLERIRTFAETIDPDTITIVSLLDGLLREISLDAEDIKSYISNIHNGLISYLRQTDPWDNNALMLAARSNPNAVEPILAAMSHLNSELQITMLRQVSTTDGGNALMLAARHHSDAVVPILEALHHLNTDLQIIILRQITRTKGNNALMLAARHQPDAVDPILRAMTHLNIDLKTAMLRQVTTANGFNALMIASCYQPNVVAPILTAMTDLNTDLQTAILMQVTRFDGLNALMIAARYHPNAVPHILTAMVQLRPELKTAILSQVTRTESFNALMIATRYQPHAVPSIIESMDLLSLNQQAEILRQVTRHDGFNALMLAACHQPDAVVPILSVITQLNTDLQAEMLRPVSRPKGYNVLMIAALKHPNVVAPILRVISYLNSNQQAEILGQVNAPNYNNALMIALIAKKHLCVDSILFRISTLSSEQRAQILLKPNKKGKTALDLVTGHFNGKRHPSHVSIMAAVDSIYSPLTLEGNATVMSSSSNPLSTISSDFASSSSAGSSGFFYHPQTSSSFAAQLAHIEKRTNVLAKDWTLSGKYLTIEVSRHQIDSVLQSLTGIPNIKLKINSASGEKTLVSVNTTSLSFLEVSTPDPEQHAGRPEDEIFDGVNNASESTATATDGADPFPILQEATCHQELKTMS